MCQCLNGRMGYVRGSSSEERGGGFAMENGRGAMLVLDWNRRGGVVVLKWKRRGAVLHLDWNRRGAAVV